MQREIPVCTIHEVKWENVKGTNWKKRVFCGMMLVNYHSIISVFSGVNFFYFNWTEILWHVLIYYSFFYIFIYLYISIKLSTSDMHFVYDFIWYFSKFSAYPDVNL